MTFKIIQDVCVTERKLMMCDFFYKFILSGKAVLTGKISSPTLNFSSRNSIKILRIRFSIVKYISKLTLQAKLNWLKRFRNV